MDEQVLWRPDTERREHSNLWRFAKRTQALHGCEPGDYAGLHQWSVTDRTAFWNAIWDEVGIVGEKGGTVLDGASSMLEERFFPQGELNFAENLLRQRGNGDALIYRAEDQVERRMSWEQLRGEVSQLQQAMRDLDIGPGDTVAGMLPNMPEAVAAMLAAASLGAQWASCSPDFGVPGAVHRFGQLSPKLLFVVDGYWYNGKWIDLGARNSEIARLLRPRRTVLVTQRGLPAGVDGYETFKARWLPVEPEFQRFPFSHPLYVVFSSGTTGLPKCIVHSAGGVLIQHMKEQQLHCDIRAGDRVFYFTTCGWMMWNWLVSALASGATLCLYDGSPFYPDGNVLFDYADAENFSFFGTSAKFIDSARKSGLDPAGSHRLAQLGAVASTGSPLAPEGFRYVYEHIKSDVHLASISGGTDILSCFVLGVPTLPVVAGEIQGAGLGMAVDVWDESGVRCAPGQKGELVCTAGFPSMPLGFWNDADGSRFRATYFERFDGVWCHGDFAEWRPGGGIVIHGRSDATLNPGGVRIGTAEIYNQVEQMPEVIEALCVSQQFEDDVRVVLFLRLAPEVALDAELEARVRQKIRTGASPRHVPAKILAVDDIPRTKSGKLAELAVRETLHGRPVPNTEALANPETLRFFVDLPQLRV